MDFIKANRKTILIFFGWLVFLLVVGYSSLLLSSFSLHPERYANDPPFYRWDSNWYISIADGGYSFVPGENSNVAFFPAYPMLIRLAHFMTGIRMSWAGFFLSIAFSFLCAIMLKKLLELDYLEKEAKNIMLTWLFYPFSFYLVSVYSESLFILLAILSLYFGRKSAWGKASIFSALAVLTRPYGILLLPVLFLEYFLQKKESGEKMGREIIRLAMPSMVAMLGFIAFNALKFQRPFAFIEAQKSWGRIFANPFPVAIAYLHEIIKPTVFSVAKLHYLADFGVLFLAIVALAFSVKKIRSSYTFLSILFLLPAFFSGTFTSAHRYALAAFPLFIVPTLWLGKNKWVFGAYIVLSSILLAFFASLFVRWAPIF